MKRRHFFTALLATGLILVVFNAFIRQLATHLPPQQLLRRIRENAPAARVIFLGDSQMEADADPAAFTRACPAKPVAINVGIGATRASEHCLILEYLLSRAPRVETVVYGFYDDLPTNPVPGGWHDLVGNRTIAYLFPERTAALIAPENRQSRWLLHLNASVPMIAERFGIWAKVERLRRRLSGVGLPAQDANQFGRPQDFSVFVPRDAAVFQNGLAQVVDTNRPLNRSVREIILISAKRNLKFYLVEMPVPGGHRRQFYSTHAWSNYREYVRKIAGDSGTFIDASDWIGDGGFGDPLHLDAAGAVVFSERLARELCAKASP